MLVQVTVAQECGFFPCAVRRYGSLHRPLWSPGVLYLRCLQGIILGIHCILRPQAFDPLHRLQGLLIKHVVISNNAELKFGFFPFAADIIACPLHFPVMTLQFFLQGFGQDGAHAPLLLKFHGSQLTVQHGKARQCLTDFKAVFYVAFPVHKPIL